MIINTKHMLEKATMMADNKKGSKMSKKGMIQVLRRRKKISNGQMTNRSYC